MWGKTHKCPCNINLSPLNIISSIRYCMCWSVARSQNAAVNISCSKMLIMLSEYTRYNQITQHSLVHHMQPGDNMRLSFWECWLWSVLLECFAIYSGRQVSIFLWNLLYSTLGKLLYPFKKLHVVTFSKTAISYINSLAPKDTYVALHRVHEWRSTRVGQTRRYL
jgi:hypothetical protein